MTSNSSRPPNTTQPVSLVASKYSNGEFEDENILNEEKQKVYEEMLTFSNMYKITDISEEDLSVDSSSGNAPEWRKIPSSMQKELRPLMSRYFQLKECKLMIQDEQRQLVMQMQKMYRKRDMRIRKEKLQKIAITQGRKAAIGEDPLKLMQNVFEKHTFRPKEK
mmetsp:Transcript_6598/g.24705  ORF Transcript_6598/g.24705 Transcript_6598/m.24705 type:complete len:164 (-) Transcript_6598:208-699(-)|eukprot:CAMPEP_0117442920 /NCGR_PEP_ID=MMETSP0759-20121206/4412_1 /TAXON_ID=63605 /ORGANISM="Percolomonas cosmopolitus, Strain WS" /LENGTH=163 /DNA_ID=CAMNT_0005234847 /DNA_START=166 /DNA_END=657 /DNA_ORIENTATION=+